MPESPRPSKNTAVVVGLCVHGLALVRSLDRAGVPVVGLEANRALPGYRTRCATVRHAPDINRPGMIDALIETRRTLDADDDPVLLLTNDNMVRVAARHWDRLEGLYRMSWSGQRERVLALLDKSSLEAHCRAHDLPYPRSWILNDAADIAALDDAGIPFPFIVKPTRPLSGFKVRLIADRAELERLAAAHPGAFPFLLQQWIAGDDRRTLFVAFYLDRGTIKATFCGRKLASKPAALGQTTIAEAFVDEGVRRLAERFFEPLGLSGPVSLEVKLDAQGRPWIIEPTLGRTDYWLDCCVANGVDLPLIEYRHQCGAPFETPTQAARFVWFDTERSPGSYIRLRLQPGATATQPWKPRFAYWDRSDPAPFRRGLSRLVGRTAGRVAGRVRRAIGR